MAIIFDFKQMEPPTRDAQSRPAGATCEIILFPGVRYERWGTAPPPEPIAETTSTQTRKRRPKKRVAEMAD
jgi:hypothetical protein